MKNRLKNTLFNTVALLIALMLCVICNIDQLYSAPVYAKSANVQLPAITQRIEVLQPEEPEEIGVVLQKDTKEIQGVAVSEAEVTETQPDSELGPVTPDIAEETPAPQEAVAVATASEASHTEAISHMEDDLHLLAKIIWFEAGSSWLSEEWKLCVGEVVLNRVASPEFPNTISEVVYQPGQYACVWRSDWDSKTFAEDDECLLLAQRLLDGERLMEPSVVFQSGCTQGSGIYTSFYDSCYGTTYFCHSSYMEHYQ